MLIYLLYWLCISITTYLIGRLIVDATAKLTSPSSPLTLPPIYCLLTGIAFISILGDIWSLFGPIGGLCQIALLLIAIGSITYLRRQIKLKIDPKSLWLLSLLFFVAILLSYQTVSFADHFAYYLPTTKWIEHFGVVPGIANLNARIGFNSNLYMLYALCNTKTVLGQDLYALNGLFFIWFNHYFISNLIRPQSNKQQTSATILLALALVFPFSFLVCTMDADYLTIMASLFLFHEFLYSKETKKAQAGQIIILSIIVAFMVTIRPFCLLLGIVPLLLSHHSIRRHLYVGIGIAGLYLLPWLIRNVLISGYLVFPFYFIDLFSVEWKIPKEVIIPNYQIIGEFAKVNIIRPAYLLDGIQSWSLTEWLPHWIENQQKHLLGLAVLGGLPLAWTASLFLISFKRKLIYHLPLLLFSIGVSVLWFLSFPAIRFGWPWISLLIALSSWPIVNRFSPKYHRVLRLGIIILVVLSWTRMIVTKGKSLETEAIHAVKLPLQQRPNYKITELGTIPIKVVEDGLCGGLEPPCMPANNQLNIKNRGLSVQEGFLVRSN